MNQCHNIVTDSHENRTRGWAFICRITGTKLSYNKVERKKRASDSAEIGGQIYLNEVVDKSALRFRHMSV